MSDEHKSLRWLSKQNYGLKVEGIPETADVAAGAALRTADAIEEMQKGFAQYDNPSRQIQRLVKATEDGTALYKKRSELMYSQIESIWNRLYYIGEYIKESYTSKYRTHFEINIFGLIFSIKTKRK